MRTTDAARPMRHRDWMTAAEEEYRRLGTLVADLRAGEWRLKTDCSEWTVHDLVAHLVGAAEAAASVRETRRQQRLGRRLWPGGSTVDGMNAVQVRERAETTPGALARALPDACSRALRARRRLPRPLRVVPVPFGPPLGTRPLGYLVDRVYTRDAWLHRVDLARATGRRLQLDAAHDGRIVADVVDEWAAAHGRPFRLTLTNPAGGTWSHGADGEELTLDAVEFCRVLSGRARGTGLLAQGVPF